MYIVRRYNRQLSALTAGILLCIGIYHSPDAIAQIEADSPEIRIEPTSLFIENNAPGADPVSQTAVSVSKSTGARNHLFSYVGPPEKVNRPNHARTAQSVIVNQRALRSGTLDIDLFGEMVTAVNTRVEVRKGQVVWVGHLQGNKYDTVIVTSRGNSFSALIQQGERVYELGLEAGGRNLLLEVDLSRLPADDPKTLPDGGGGVPGSADRAVPMSGNVVQDLLAVYTESACAAAGSCEQVVTSIVTAVADMNTAYQASGINITMNLVGTHLTAYDGEDFNTALMDLTNDTDGKMDEVHDVRDQLGADIVAMVFGGDGNYCGLGWVNSSAWSAFSVTALSCVVGNRSFAHEIGHNQGAEHDRVSAGAGDSENYNYGFRRCSDGSVEDLGAPYFRTIMAYSCSGEPRQGIYSNPDIDFQGVPQGVDPLVVPTGGAHNARRLNERAETVAAFRATASTNEFVIYNDGGSNLSVSSITTETAAPWITWTPAAPFNVAPGGTAVVSVEIDFLNAPEGLSENRLLVYSNDADESPYPGAVLISVQNSSCSDDEYESTGFDGTDDLCYGADIGPLPGAQTHRHCDADWVTFQAQAGVDYVIETNNLTGGSDTTLSLHFDCGEQIATDDDGGSELYASRIEFTAGSSGWYDIQIRQFADDYQDGEGYDITVSPLVDCHTLSTDYTGSGAAPNVSPVNSAGCAAGSYVAGEVISLTANPDEGWTVESWNGTDNDVIKALTNSWTMTDADHLVTVNYAEGDPVAEIYLSPTILDFTNVAADPVVMKTSGYGLQDTIAKLQQKVESKGNVKLIVGLDVDTRPEGGLNALQRANQRARIKTAQDDFVKRLGLAPGQSRKFKTIPYVAFSATTGQLKRIAGMPGVAHVQEDKLAMPTLASSNPVIGSPAAWAQGYDGSGFAVAVLDTGVDKTHPYFSTGVGKVVSEACYSSNYAPNSATSVCPGGAESSTAEGSGEPCDMNADGGCAHGTHVAGIVAGHDGSGPNYGVARGADIIAIQVFSMFDDADICSSNGPPCVLTYSSDQISGLERVLELSATMDIAAANMSLGGGVYYNQASCDADHLAEKAIIDNLRSAGIATVIASGNEGYTDATGGPACISSAVSVGSTTDVDDVSSFSNVADFLDLLAPGSFITSSVPGGNTETWNGTSMATPHVAGAWAVLRQKSPGASVDSLLSVLRDTGNVVDDQRVGGSVTGLRRINLDTALLSLESDNSKNFVIANVGGADLEITSLGLETPADWITWSVDTPFTIPPGTDKTITVNVDFAGAPAGVSANRLLVYSNDDDASPYPAAVIINIEKRDDGFIFRHGFE